MSEVVYKVRFSNGDIGLVKYLGNHELIEEVEVPEGEDVDDFLYVQRNEVYLGSFCERKTRFC